MFFVIFIGAVTVGVCRRGNLCPSTNKIAYHHQRNQEAAEGEFTIERFMRFSLGELIFQ